MQNQMDGQGFLVLLGLQILIMMTLLRSTLILGPQSLLMLMRLKF